MLPSKLDKDIADFVSDLKLEQKDVELLAPSPQNFRKAYQLVASGDVSGISFDLPDGRLSLEGHVHSEKSASVIYLVSVTIDRQRNLWAYSCCCKGNVPLEKTGAMQKCKHVTALLAALDAIGNDADSLQTPRRFRRSGMGIFDGACDRVLVRIRLSSCTYFF